KPATSRTAGCREPREVRALEKKLRRELGFAVAVYPVIVLWADFPQRQTYVGDVSLLSGRELVGWLPSRPVDFVNEGNRGQGGDWVGGAAATNADLTESAITVHVTPSWVEAQRCDAETDRNLDGRACKHPDS